MENTFESPMDSKEIKPVNPKGNQPWIFIGRMDAEAPILWPSDAKSWLTGKDPDAGKDWRCEEKGMAEDAMVGWQNQLNEHESEQAPGDGEGQGSLACCSPSGSKESDTTERLNNNKAQDNFQVSRRNPKFQHSWVVLVFLHWHSFSVFIFAKWHSSHWHSTTPSSFYLLRAFPGKPGHTWKTEYT